MKAAASGFELPGSKADSSEPTGDSPELDQVTIAGAQASAAFDNKSTASTNSLLLDCSSSRRRAGRASETQLTARAFGAAGDSTRAPHSEVAGPAHQSSQALEAASSNWLPELSHLDVYNPMCSNAEGMPQPCTEPQPQYAVQPVTLTEVQLPAIPLFSDTNPAHPVSTLEQQQSSHSPSFQDAVDALLTASNAHSWGSFSRPTTPNPIDSAIPQSMPITHHHEAMQPSDLQAGLPPGTSLWPEDAQAGDKRSMRDDGTQEQDFWGADGDEDGGARGKRPRLVWTPELHTRFINAVTHLGLKNAVPKLILQLMNVEGMTRENVASHLQKYRMHLKKGAGYPAAARLSADTMSQLQQEALHQMQQEQYTAMFPAFMPPPMGTMPHACYPSPVPALPMGNVMPPGLTPVPPMAVYPFPWMGIHTQPHLSPQVPCNTTCGPPLFSPQPMGSAMGIQPLVQHAIPLSPSTAGGAPQWVWGAPSPQQQLQMQQQMHHQGMYSHLLAQQQQFAQAHMQHSQGQHAQAGPSGHAEAQLQHQHQQQPSMVPASQQHAQQQEGAEDAVHQGEQCGEHTLANSPEAAGQQGIKFEETTLLQGADGRHTQPGAMEKHNEATDHRHEQGEQLRVELLEKGLATKQDALEGHALPQASLPVILPVPPPAAK